jgi:hypothetical protein
MAEKKLPPTAFDRAKGSNKLPFPQNHFWIIIKVCSNGLMLSWMRYNGRFVSLMVCRQQLHAERTFFWWLDHKTPRPLFNSIRHVYEHFNKQYPACIKHCALRACRVLIVRAAPSSPLFYISGWLRKKIEKFFTCKSVWEVLRRRGTNPPACRGWIWRLPKDAAPIREWTNATRTYKITQWTAAFPVLPRHHN